MKPSQLTAAIFCLTLILIATGCTDQKETPIETASEQTTPTTTQDTVTISGQNLTIHFLDVDQGDSILLEIDGKSMTQEKVTREKLSQLTCRTREFQHWIM